MTCICFEGGKAERECCLEWMDRSNELALLMAWTRNLRSLVMET